MEDRMDAPALEDRLIESAIGSLELIAVHLGRVLGLYELLQHPRTSTELAEDGAIDDRYAREWLEQQAVAGFVNVDDPALPWDRRRYSLDDTQKAVFVTPDHPLHVSPLADMVIGASEVVGKVARSFRTGGGVPYADYGPIFRSGQAGINRPAFTTDLVESWIDAIPDVVARLEQGGRIADVGCGEGWSTIALANRFPNAEVLGIDNDRSSIEAARAHAVDMGSRARFQQVGAADVPGEFDLVVILEALHDMAHPVESLTAVRRSLSDGGAVLVADEKVAEEFGAIGDQLERMMYGWSVAHCLPASMAEPDSAAIGTVLRPRHVEQLAREAGFGTVKRSDIDAGFFSLYVMR